MSSVVTLHHPTLRVDGFVVHSYDGFVQANGGVADIPADDLLMIETVFRKGFNLSPDGRRLWTTDDLWTEVERQTAKSADAPVSGRKSRVASEASVTGRG